MMLLLGARTAALVQATTGQKQGTNVRAGSSPCSVAPQQDVLHEVKGFTSKSGLYRLAPLAPALPGLVPGCTMTLKHLLLAIRVGGGRFGGRGQGWRENNPDSSFLSASSNCTFQLCLSFSSRERQI